MGDVFFDLANFSVNHELDEDGARRAARGLLRRRCAAGDRRVLELMRFMSDFREAMWGVVQAAVSELDFDFAAYAAEHFERLERTAAEPSFQAALGRLRRRGAPAGAPRRTVARLRPLGGLLGRKLESAELLLLEPLELLLGAHPDRALEPVLRRHQPPAAEEDPDPGEPEDRVVRQLPGEVVLPRAGRPCRAGT